MFALRDYQNSGVFEIRSAYKAGTRAVLYQLCTGGGKSCIFVYITKHAAAKGNRVWIIVHRQELIRQVHEHLVNQGVPHGLIVSGRTENPAELVQVCSIQTLVRRLDRLSEPDLIIIDEAHHSLAMSWATILKRYEAAKVLGVSGTPLRINGAGLGRQWGGYYDTMICGPSVTELTSRGFLSPAIYYAPPCGLNLSGVHTVAGDFNKHEVEVAVDRPRITGSAVAHYTRLAPGKPAIVFCCSVKHAEHVCADFKAAGYKAEIIDGNLDDNIRADRIKALGDGRLQLLISIDVLGEGVDVPVVEVGILLRPTESLVVHLQQLGRILRPARGKTMALVLDHAGNCIRHGLASDERVWSLEGREMGKRKSKSSVPIKQCSRCFAVFPPAPKCPQCGHVFEINGREVDQVAGELVQLSAEEMGRRLSAQDDRERKDRQHLEKIAKARGYKPGWIEHILGARKAKRTGT